MAHLRVHQGNYATGGDVLTVDLATGTAARERGPVATLRFAGLPDRVKDVEIWLPHTETTELVALRTDAHVAPTPARGRPVWVHHGSSISHGSDAASPTITWPAIAAARGGVELANLGFGGGALLDPPPDSVRGDPHPPGRSGTPRPT